MEQKKTTQHKKNNEYKLGTIRMFGVWPELRALLGCLFNGSLTPFCLSAGDSGWIITVRATRRLSKDELTWLYGWFDGFTKATTGER